MMPKKHVVFFLMLGFCEVFCEEKSSFILVIDDTGSMSNEIRQVKDSANAIFDAVLNSNDSQIEDFVLVTFNDPDIEERVITQDRNEYKKALAAIDVHGGDDCPEFSMSGIIKGLQLGRAGSTVYVFTDASAKDSTLYNDAKSLALKKQMQVVFMLTGICTDEDDPAFLVYKNLTSDTRGQIFHVEKHDIKDILAYVVENAKGRRTILAEGNFPRGSHSLNFTVDSNSRNPILAVTGTNAIVKLTGPEGDKVDMKLLVNKRRSKVATVLNPTSGVYTVGVDSESESRVLVTAQTSVRFQQGFSTFRPTSIKDTTTRPIPDVKSYITIHLTDGDIELKTVKILRMDGTLIKELPLEVLDAKDKLYATELEDLPDTIFKIAIAGFDPSNDEEIIREGPPIVPQPKVSATNKSPHVSILGAPALNVSLNKPLQLSCKVNGFPQPDVVWTIRDTGEKLKANVSIVELPDDFISILSIDKVIATEYECQASNSLGSDAAVIKVQGNSYFRVLRRPTDTTVNYQDSGELYCKVDAYPPATIYWYKDRKPLPKVDNIQLSADKSVLTVKEMTPADAGSFFCEARNSDYRKVFSAELSIAGVAGPQINKTVSEINPVVGSDAVISCNLIKGIPTPKITWEYDNNRSEFVLLDAFENKTSITLRNITERQQGTFHCIAENVVSTDQHDVFIRVQIPASITEGAEEVDVSDGETFRLPCSVTGWPAPTVTWFKDNMPLRKTSNIYLFRDHTLKIKADPNVNGTYTCNATNYLRSASRVVKVNLHVPVSILILKNTKMSVQIGDSVDLPCQARGHPPPKTTWTYFTFDSTVPPRTLMKSPASSTLSLRSMALGEDGYYTCTASNVWGQTNITYELHVLARPVIEKTYTDNTFKAVEGDLGLRIPCRASGQPSPVIKWLKDGYYVTSGFTTEDGSLFVENMSKDDEGTYVCEAKNVLGTAREAFKVIVNKSPEAGTDGRWGKRVLEWRPRLGKRFAGHPPIRGYMRNTGLLLGPRTSTITIGDGDTAAVQCDLPHTRRDLLRWFKNGALIHTGELIIRNAVNSDSGVYTCRVGDFGFSDGQVLVKVGHKPTFQFDEPTDIMFEEGAPYTLSCDADGDPRPTYTWWHNDELLETTESFYSWTMELGTQGQYVCKASNKFGNIARTYNVDSRDCIVNIKGQTSKLQPLMISSKLEWVEHPVQNGFMSIPRGEYVVLACPHRFKTLPKSYTTAFCQGGNKFKILGRIYDYEDIECTQKVEHIVENTDEKCYEGNTELVKVGFTVLSETIEAYEVCLDKDKQRPVYTRMRMRHSAADVDYSEHKWSDDGIDLDFRSAYDCDRQINATSSDLGRWFHKKDGCCFGKRQLVSPKDLQIGVAQRAAYSKLNVVPQWSTCNADSNNWNELEQRVRKLVKSSFTELSVITGVADDLTLPASDTAPHRVHVTDRRTQQAVPKYMWKLVQEPSSASSLVIVQVNVPDLRPFDAPAHVRCRDICDSTKWMKGSNWYDVSKGFTYCCSLKDFEDSFGYKYVFEPYYSVLRDVSLLPDSINLT